MNIGTIASLLLIVAIVLLAAVLVRRRATSEGEDPGSALLDFGAAFPDAAVRDVVCTADGAATFLRLADGRTGLVRTVGARRAIRLIEPGSVRAEGPAGEGGRGIALGGEGGEMFLFARSEDAAEVLLWLCSSYAAAEPGAGGAGRSPL